MIISPIVSIFSNNASLEDSILRKISDYSKMYVDSYNDLAGKTNNESLSKGYEDGLKSVLQLKLDEYGYEIVTIMYNSFLILYFFVNNITMNIYTHFFIKVTANFILYL